MNQESSTSIDTLLANVQLDQDKIYLEKDFHSLDNRFEKSHYYSEHSEMCFSLYDKATHVEFHFQSLGYDGALSFSHAHIRMPKLLMAPLNDYRNTA